MPEDIKLDGHHRATVEKIFQHPSGHNIQWHDVLSLLERVATVVEEHDGRYKVTLGSETETLDAPRGHEMTRQMVGDRGRLRGGPGWGPALPDRPGPESPTRRVMDDY